MKNVELHRIALRKALEVRASGGIGRTSPVCVYDLAQRMEVEVRFCAETSLEGLYMKSPRPLILVSGCRPPGRQMFSCAHELGHHVFKHGNRVDEIFESEQACHEKEPEEVLADSFAGSLLMPISVVEDAFRIRSISIDTCTPLHLYTLAHNFGVGYDTLLSHLQWSLKLLSKERSDYLRKTSPKQIHKALLPEVQAERIVPVDMAWSGAAIDLRVGDLAVLPTAIAIEGSSVRHFPVDGKETVIEACRTGVSRLEAVNGTYWSAFVRVARKEFIGRSIFRHEEDPDEQP